MGGIEDFDEFATHALPRLLGVATALTGNPHDAWDLSQEALTRVGIRWKRLDAQGNPYGYARQTLVRLNIDRMRKYGRERPVAEVVDLGVPVQAVEGLDGWLVEGLRSLSSRQRTAIVLRYAEDLDVAGVAAAMDCSTGTAKSHLSRGLARLRQQAAAYAEGVRVTDEL